MRPPQQALVRNSMRTCTAPGCNGPRRGFSLWCSKCISPASRYGHPHGRPIEDAAWSHQRAEVATLLQVNADHPGLVQAVGYLSKWMADAKASERAYKGAEEVARLVRHGVTPLQVLQALAGMYCYLMACPRAVPDQRAFDFALSRAVFALAPRPRRVTFRPGAKDGEYALRARTSSLDAVGKHLRLVLVAFLANVRTAVEEREQRAQRAVAALRAPLVSDTAALLEEVARKGGPTA
jgi:hypothetical protein